MDVTPLREEQARRDLLIREVDHRAKNVLAVVQAVLKLTPADDPKRFTEVVEGRIAALARAHALLARDQWAGADVRALLGEELAPFLAGGAAPAPPPKKRPGTGRRVALDGPPVGAVALGRPALRHVRCTNWPPTRRSTGRFRGVAAGWRSTAGWTRPRATWSCGGGSTGRQGRAARRRRGAASARG